MRILYCGLLYNYGKPEEGYSYEHVNLEAGLKDCGLFDVMSFHPDVHNNHDVILSSLVNGDFDAIFHVAFSEDLDLPEGIAQLALQMDIPVIQFDCDSSWRFQQSILPRKHRVSHFITTHSCTVDWYKENGMNVIKSQWGGSPNYHPRGGQHQYDVTFLGQKHGRMPNGRFWRAEVVDAILASGINLKLFGNYWDGYQCWGGYLKDFHQMIDVFDQSKICLNLSNPWHYGTMEQIKGRHFEIPQIGRLQVCTRADDLESYFEFGKEIVVAESVQDLIEKLRYYLQHGEEREKIAMAGRQRMLKEHQWRHRFEAIFKEIGIL